MTILINKNTKVIVQGITGHHGSIHTKFMKEFGTKIVAGVTPGKGGQSVEGIPVYNSVKEALKKHKATWSVVFVPPQFAKAAAIEALQNKLNVVMITEHVPVHDTLEVIHTARKVGKRVLGPNCPGLVAPDQSKIAIMPNFLFKAPQKNKKGIGVVARSGTLLYEIVHQLSEHGFPQSVVVGIGGDPVPSTNFIDVLKLLEKDKQTKKIVMVGEIGGTAEEEAADYIQKHMKKQVVAYIAGITAPPGKTMGHAGAIISGSGKGVGTAKYKIDYLRNKGIKVVTLPYDIVKVI